MIENMPETSRKITEISQWIDAGNSDRDSEAVTWGRLAKIAEECGEVIAAYIGATGQNPRKGVTHTDWHVSKELLDVAITALAAYQHINGHVSDPLIALCQSVEYVHNRAGLS